MTDNPGTGGVVASRKTTEEADVMQMHLLCLVAIATYGQICSMVNVLSRKLAVAKVQ